MQVCKLCCTGLGMLPGRTNLSCKAEVVIGLCRLVAPVLLRGLLRWLRGNAAQGYSVYPLRQGWMYASLLAISGFVLSLIHHQLFWCGAQTSAWNVLLVYTTTALFWCPDSDAQSRWNADAHVSYALTRALVPVEDASLRALAGVGCMLDLSCGSSVLRRCKPRSCA